MQNCIVAEPFILFGFSFLGKRVIGFQFSYNAFPLFRPLLPAFNMFDHKFSLQDLRHPLPMFW